eukprot:TRINITY_DN1124_c0_g2_i6.p1 TRINITY_DN1124_c0_g2~~TRINITY_DN1124_c0_g2_i6.p1  ORF type:complete len:166 (+),score=64.72 TRINITY_DN1124_c0_g2_i6:250-747(+)
MLTLLFLETLKGEDMAAVDAPALCAPLLAYAVGRRGVGGVAVEEEASAHAARALSHLAAPYLPSVKAWLDVATTSDIPAERELATKLLGGQLQCIERRGAAACHVVRLRAALLLLPKDSPYKRLRKVVKDTLKQIEEPLIVRVDTCEYLTTEKIAKPAAPPPSQN